MRKFMVFVCAIMFIVAIVFFGLFAMGVLGDDGVIHVNQMAYVSGGFTFSGDLRDGLFSGDGTINFQDGSRYNGGFAAGRFEGKATFITEGGEWSFDGIFQNGRASQGTFFLNDGAEIAFDRNQPENEISGSDWQYRGNFNERGQNGHGVFAFFDGSVYEGEFFDGLAHGPGVYTSSEGWIYEGNFKDGMFDGEGKITEGNSINRGIWEKGVQITRYE